MAPSHPSRPLLLCFDGSPDAIHALEQAALVAPGAPAIVLHIWHPPSAFLFEGRTVEKPHPLAPMAEEFDAAAAEKAAQVAAEGERIARQAGFEASSLTIRSSQVWQAIVRTAEERDVAAVVVGSRGHSRFESVLGSIAHGVVNHSAKPVLLVPAAPARD